MKENTKFSESKYQKLIGIIPIHEIIVKLYENGFRQKSSRYAILENENEILTECGNALVKAVRKLERQNEN